MATRRSHTTELGCIACDDLGDIAAGKEAWLVDNPDILCALDTHLLAFSNKTLILILRWAATGRGGLVDSPVKFRPDLDGEHITALEWLAFDHIRVLAVGTSSGFLIVYSVDGVLIHKQAIHPGHILKFRVHGRKGDPMQDTVDEVCVVIPGIIARLDGSDIKCMLERLFEGKNSQSWNLKLKNKSAEESENSFERLPYQVWNINKYGVCADAAITGIMPPPLMELESSQRYYCAVAIGADAVISAFRLSENRSRSVVGAIFSKVVPVTFSTIASFSKMIWRSEPTPSKKPEVKPQPFARASALTCLKDHPRKGEKLTLSPSGTLAAVTDSLGRILLLDTQALVVVRLWKGYRDANCLFMEMLVNDDTSALASNNYLKSDYCLCLAIHAPRKGIVEIWKMRTGPRLLTIQCPKGCKILQPACGFGSSLESSSSYAPLEVFLLNGDSGQIFVLNKTLA